MNWLWLRMLAGQRFPVSGPHGVRPRKDFSRYHELRDVEAGEDLVLLLGTPECFLRTTRDIRYHDMEFRCTYDAVIQHLGEPLHVLEMDVFGRSLQTLFFEKKIAQHPAVLQAHLLESQLVFGSITFRDIGLGDRRLLREALEAKYLGAAQVRHEERLTVCDTRNNRLELIDGVHCVVRCICGDESILGEIAAWRRGVHTQQGEKRREQRMQEFTEHI